jgi:hypothetical protein
MAERDRLRKEGKLVLFKVLGGEMASHFWSMVGGLLRSCYGRGINLVIAV